MFGCGCEQLLYCAIEVMPTPRKYIAGANPAAIGIFQEKQKLQNNPKGGTYTKGQGNFTVPRVLCARVPA
jgi:hypothetical protein